MMREELNQARCFGGKPVVKTGRTHRSQPRPNSLSRGFIQEKFEPGCCAPGNPVTSIVIASFAVFTSAMFSSLFLKNLRNIRAVHRSRQRLRCLVLFLLARLHRHPAFVDSFLQ
jgi:hypothetical protein